MTEKLIAVAEISGSAIDSDVVVLELPSVGNDEFADSGDGL